MKNAAMKWMVLCVLAIAMLGCVSQRRADDLETLYRRSQEQVIDLRSQLEEAQARIKALQSAPPTQDADMLARLEACMAERDALAKALAQAEESLRSAGRASIALPEDLNQALVGLAESNPNLIEYDAQRGMLRFRSDLTFPSGSTEVTSDARNSLGKLADILKSASASNYETRVVGHTDNVPVSKPATKALHPDNWYLSVHRAISVMNILRTAGVPPVRMAVVGHGEYRPVVSTTGNRGAEANRRVEIYLVPSTYTGPSGTARAAQQPARSSSTQQPAAGSIGEAPAPTESPAQFK